jgi:hypothetical protein
VLPCVDGCDVAGLAELEAVLAFGVIGIAHEKRGMRKKNPKTIPPPHRCFLCIKKPVILSLFLF